MNNQNQLIIAAIILAGGLMLAAILFTSGGNNTPKGGTKVFDVVMENNRYNPSKIVANVGDTVIINFTNKDNVAHGIAIPEFNATVPNGHIPPNGTAQMKFYADRPLNSDTALCGGPNPSDKSDDHGEEFIVQIN